MELKDKEHLLALKVMRLTKPSFYMTLPITCDNRDLPGDLFNKECCDDIGSFKGLEMCSLGELLMLPQSFGNIFLGETFSSYISVHNDSDQIVHDVSVKADLQTGSQRISLPSTSNKVIAGLTPSECVDDIIHHEVKEIGTHILVCSVAYTTRDGEKMYFRKFFKFQVMKPLDVKTKFYNAESDEVYIEAQVQNITSSPICLERVSLDPSSLFNIVEMNTIKHTEKCDSIFGHVNALNPLDSRQYLYCLTPKVDRNQKILKGVTSVGKLDILWRSSMADKGRLQTSQLQRMAPAFGDIRFTVEEIPSEVEIEKPFQIICRVSNSCERAVNLELVLDGTCSPGLCWIGISGQSLGQIQAEAYVDIHLELVPIQLGLQTISGIRLIDTFLKRTYDYDELAQVFVNATEMSDI